MLPSAFPSKGPCIRPYFSSDLSNPSFSPFHLEMKKESLKLRIFKVIRINEKVICISLHFEGHLHEDIFPLLFSFPLLFLFIFVQGHIHKIEAKTLGNTDNASL